MLYVDPIQSPFIRPSDKNPDASLRREQLALQELEHYFLYMLLQELRRSVYVYTPMSRSREISIYEEFFDDVLSGEMAQSGQIGLAQQLAEQLRVHELQTQLGCL